MSQFEKLQKAAALKYSPSSPDDAPVVVASGAGEAAQRIIGIAERSGVPVFRDDSLATLLSQMRAGTEIPPELYQAVVDIYLYFLGFSVDAQGKVTREPPAGKEEAPAGAQAEPGAPQPDDSAAVPQEDEKPPAGRPEETPQSF